MPALAPAPTRPARRRTAPKHTPAPRASAGVMLPVPMPSPGESSLVGLADWQMYLQMDRVCQGKGMRARFHRGIIEVMIISFLHESLKFVLSRMITSWCDHHAIDYISWGSTTQRVEGIMGGEPDDSFSFGEEMKAQPDLFIEVALSSGGIDKLSFWGELKAREVWIWQNGRLHAFTLGVQGYQPAQQSEVLPGIDLRLIEQLAEMKPHSKAVRQFQASLK